MVWSFVLQFRLNRVFVLFAKFYASTVNLVHLHCYSGGQIHLLLEFIYLRYSPVSVSFEIAISFCRISVTESVFTT